MDKQAKAEARRQQIINEKINRAKVAQTRNFVMAERVLDNECCLASEDLVMVERPHNEEESKQQEVEMPLVKKQQALEEQKRLLEEQLEQVKKQMNLTLT